MILIHCAKVYASLYMESPGRVFDPQDLVKIANMEMPFGKFRGRPLINLPEPYLLWFAKEGFPDGRLGALMQLTLEIKINGLESLISPLKDQDPSA